MSAPPKIRAPLPARSGIAAASTSMNHAGYASTTTNGQQNEDTLGPLRDSRRLNVVKHDSTNAAGPSYDGRDDLDPKSTNNAAESKEEREESPKDDKMKGDNVSIQDASLLLGLRTSASGTSSPANTVTTHASLDDIKLSHTSSMEESVAREGPAAADAKSTATDRKPSPQLQHDLHQKQRQQAKPDFPARVPKNYPTRLALPEDDTKLNSLHCFIRTHLLEIFVVQPGKSKSPTHSTSATSSSIGRVGLRCVHCADARKRAPAQKFRDEAPMAIFYPKSVAEIYRLVTSWQRCHLRKCRNLPPSIRSEWDSLRESDKSRGKTAYWVKSAKHIGLVDCQSRAGGIRFDIPEDGGEGSKGESTGRTQDGSSGSDNNDKTKTSDQAAKPEKQPTNTAV